jgi:hypothetical protein
VRLRSDLRRDIGSAASKYGRSLSDEIESRLEVSFSLKQYLRHEWGDDLFKIAEAMADALARIENMSGGKRWLDDEKVYEVFQLTTTEIIRNYRDRFRQADGRDVPHGALAEKTPEELAKFFASLAGVAPPRRPPLSTKELSRGPDESTTADWENAGATAASWETAFDKAKDRRL